MRPPLSKKSLINIRPTAHSNTSFILQPRRSALLLFLSFLSEHPAGPINVLYLKISQFVPPTQDIVLKKPLGLLYRMWRWSSSLLTSHQCIKLIYEISKWNGRAIEIWSAEDCAAVLVQNAEICSNYPTIGEKHCRLTASTDISKQSTIFFDISLN